MRLLAEHVILISGATDGLGKAIAMQLKLRQLSEQLTGLTSPEKGGDRR